MSGRGCKGRRRRTIQCFVDNGMMYFYHMQYTETNRLSLKYNGTLNIALYESERSYVFTYFNLLKRNLIIIINLNWALSPI